MSIYSPILPPVLFDTLTANNGSRIGVATLNAEKTLNALSLEMIDLLWTQLTAWAADPGMAIVVLQAAGEKAFCAGGDLQNLYRSMLAHHASDAKDDICGNVYANDFFEREYRLDYLIHTYPKPVLCWGHGIVMGGGIGLMAGASHRVVTEKSRMAMPEAAIGLFPDVGGTWFLNRMPGRLGLFLALTGVAINASDAKFVKLADYAIAQSQKQAVLDTLLNTPWSAAPAENSRLLGAVLRQAQSLQDFPAGPLRQHFDLIESLCDRESLAQIIAAIKALDIDDPWLKKASAAVVAAAPVSLQLAYLLLQRVPHLSLAQVFRMEYAAALHCAAGPDFAEGIRALLIDKDQKPQWQSAAEIEARRDWPQEVTIGPWSEQTHPLADLGRS
jgi:enoyl-CoA hydratase/carnithine racemase